MIRVRQVCSQFGNELSRCQDPDCQASRRRRGLPPRIFAPPPTATRIIPLRHGSRWRRGDVVISPENQRQRVRLRPSLAPRRRPAIVDRRWELVFSLELQLLHSSDRKKEPASGQPWARGR